MKYRFAWFVIALACIQCSKKSETAPAQTPTPEAADAENRRSPRPTETLKPGKTASPVRVDSVITRSVGEHGFPQTQVSVRATFGNSCVVPFPDELVQITEGRDNFNTLNITLGSTDRRMCTMLFQPVTVTIDLGTHTKPNDGNFSKIVVNGVQAQLH